MMLKNFSTLNSYKIINIGNNRICSKATTAMTDAAMLLLLRRQLTDIVTFCAQHKIREPKIGGGNNDRFAGGKRYYMRKLARTFKNKYF
jgi:hypothetical protein